MTNTKPRVLIEDWLPVAELGIESRRESAPIPGQFPKLKTLHVWWARRPLVASAAVALAGLLPTWSQALSDTFPESEDLLTAKSYRIWVLRLIGIWGDPVAARKRINAANAAGKKLGAAAYGYKPAFKNMPGKGDLDLLHAVLRSTWETDSLPMLADPTAGGGSIPFAAARLGIPTYANDLNAVAASILTAGVSIPAEYGNTLSKYLESYGKIWLESVQDRLTPFFHYEGAESYVTYIWANAVRCPRTGGVVPLITDQWLQKTKGAECAVRIVAHDATGSALTVPRYEIARGRDIDFDPSNGLMTGGSARSPYDDLIIDGDYIKKEAKDGRLEQVLYAVYYRTADGRKGYRSPSSEDIACIETAGNFLEQHRDRWELNGCLPTQEIPDVSNYDRGHRMYGMQNWADMFTSRQLVVHAVFAEELQNIAEKIKNDHGDDFANPIITVLSMVQAKALNYNARSTSWDISRQKIRGVFEKHNFAFRWTFAEFQGSHELPAFALKQIIESYDQLCALLGRADDGIMFSGDTKALVRVSQHNAANMPSLRDGSITHLCMDPPYYNNVMYAELSDFFYVWERGTLGKVLPKYFAALETDKADEAIANPARFSDFGRRKDELADADYEAKMTAIFTECSRVLTSNGVMTVMFTHKRADAWDALGSAIINAGFTIEASWPVNTESDASSHQNGKNAAKSTIMLVCRKRVAGDEVIRRYLDDIDQEIREAARSAAKRFQEYGIEGVDLLLSTYGPTLAVISKNWPVYSSIPDPDGRDQLLRPDRALDLAREEVVQLRRARLVGKAAHVDDMTDFVLLSWDIFSAREFSYDTARLLALAVGGVDVEHLERSKILKKKTGTVILLEPGERLRRESDSELPGVRPEAANFEFMIDAVDTALYIADVDGMPAAKRFLDRHGFTADSRFISTAQGLVNAIPRTKAKGAWVIPVAGLLDTLCTLYFPTVTLPEAEDLATPPVQESLFGDD